MSMQGERLPRMMLGFLVRRCAVALGHAPTPAEFAAWANGGYPRVFGRAISEAEARVILRHQARLVTARSATAAEQASEATVTPLPPNVVRMADMRARRR